MKLLKPAGAIIAIFVLGSIAVIGWQLSQRLPEIDPPQMAIDHRHISGPQLEDQYLAPPEWKREILSRFDENDLRANSDSSVKVYRLVFLPSFRAPVCIRIENRAGQFAAVATKLKGTAGFTFDELGTREPEKARFISEADWLAFERLIETSRFWELETVDLMDEPVNDGAFWVLEGENGLYHRVQRIQPPRDLRMAMLRMIELAGVRNDYESYFTE